jgi:Fe2+ or Zn2+ uptake regulation protein
MHGCIAGLDRLAPEGFQAEAHEIVLYGRCQGCNRGGVRR